MKKENALAKIKGILSRRRWKKEEALIMWKKQVMAWLICMGLVLSLFAGVPMRTRAAAFFTGEGTQQNPYLIQSKEDMYLLATTCTAGNTYVGRYFQMTRDIDLSSNVVNVWQGIGSETTPFRGNFDGNNHAIKGIYITTTASSCGLFNLTEGGSISNLYIYGSVKGSSQAGGIAGYATQTTFGNCHNYASVEGAFAGGIAGNSVNCTFDACHNEGRIYAQVQENSVAGGIAGEAEQAKVQRCFNDGYIYSKGLAGGITGEGGNISQCYNTGYVGGAHSGGITTGYSGLGLIQNCYNVGIITNGGGITCDAVTGNVMYCYQAGTATGGRQGIYVNNTGTAGTGYNVGCCYAYVVNAGIAQLAATVGPGEALDEAGFANPAKFFGWDFNNIWIMEAGLSQGLSSRPVLRGVGKEGGAFVEPTWNFESNQGGNSKTTPAEPVNLIGKWDETLTGENKGVIQNVNSTMEYSTNGVLYYAITTNGYLTNLAPGTYYVRYRETATANAGKAAIILIAKPTAYTGPVIQIRNMKTLEVPCRVTGTTVTVDSGSAEKINTGNLAGVIGTTGSSQLIVDCSSLTTASELQIKRNGMKAFYDIVLTRAVITGVLFQFKNGSISLDKAALEELLKGNDSVYTIKIKTLSIAVENQSTAQQPSQENPVSQSDVSGAFLLNEELSVTQKNNKLYVEWGQVPQADGYEIYAALAGSEFETDSPTAVVNANSMTAVTINLVAGKAVNTRKVYKVKVVAYRTQQNGRTPLYQSLVAYVAGRLHKTYTNPSDVVLTERSFLLGIGEAAFVEATVVKANTKKKLLAGYCNKLRYKTSDAAVATVSSTGKVIARGAGTCTVYVFAKNGFARKVKVKVTG